MSNNNNPHGFRPLGWCLGGGPPFITSLQKAASYGTAIYPFDLIERATGGTIDTAITPGTTYLSGVALDYGALSTLTTHLCVISADAIFEAQDNNQAADGGIVAADLGQNANCIVSVAGSLTLKQSGHQINSGTVATTNTFDLKLLQLLNVPDNAFGPNARIEVLINKHRMNPGVAGV